MFLDLPQILKYLETNSIFLKYRVFFFTAYDPILFSKTQLGYNN